MSGQKYLVGIVGWSCPICRGQNASSRNVCRCGESHRPSEFWAAEIRAFRAENIRLRSLCLLAWALFAVVCSLAAVAVCAVEVWR